MFDPIQKLFELFGVEILMDGLTMGTLIPYIFSVIVCLVLLLYFFNFVKYISSVALSAGRGRRP